MYTISMRPNTPNSSIKKCANFEQERASWGLAGFQDTYREGCDTAFGLVFHSPIESIDISVVQLAAMIAGLDAAYADLCNALYADAPRDLVNTPWHDLETFMSCIPRGVYESAPELPGAVYARDAKPIPLLYNHEKNLCISWTGSKWGTTEPPVEIASYDSAGTCFGWDVRYQEEVMSTECVKDPTEIVNMLIGLLEAFNYLDTEAKVYVHNIYSVQ